MENQNRVWLIALGLIGAIVLLVLATRVQEELRPQPLRAHVAIGVGTEPARIGRIEIRAGTPFFLYAVLEAKGRDGESVFYTEARALTVGGKPVPENRLRPTARFDEARVLWFSVEGARPYLELEESDSLEALEFREIFRADWARAWSLPGSIASAQQEASGGRDGLPVPDFGTLRFHVRIEVFGPQSDITPIHRLHSLAAAELPSEWRRFPTVSATLEGALAPVTRLFGLPQVELAPGAAREEQRTLYEWTERALAFSRLTLLRRLIDETGVAWEDVRWTEVELDGSRQWPQPGDLLQAGPRLVMLLKDEGVEGRLDYDDLCLDFDRGAAIRRLGEIFTGKGVVEWARLQ